VRTSILYPWGGRADFPHCRVTRDFPATCECPLKEIRNIWERVWLKRTRPLWKQVGSPELLTFKKHCHKCWYFFLPATGEAG
jgi:hypothetical protein